MPVNLLAICSVGNALQLKRVVVAQPVQVLLEGTFSAQESSFLADISGEVDFDGSWKPEDDELLRAPTAGQLEALWAQSSQNIISFDPINPAALASEGIRGLCVSIGDGGNRRLLIQNFSARQILNRGALAFRYDGNTFDRLTEPSFSIANNLSAILQSDYLKFKSFTSVKMIFDLANVYQEASDAQIGAFGAHASLHIADIAEFKGFSDQGIRKLVTAIGKKKVLDNFTPAQIVAAAATTTLTIDLDQGKIVMPRSRAEAKKLLHFLDEGFYKGPLSGVAFITNSKRRA